MHGCMPNNWQNRNPHQHLPPSPLLPVAMEGFWLLDSFVWDHEAWLSGLRVFSPASGSHLMLAVAD